MNSNTNNAVANNNAGASGNRSALGADAFVAALLQQQQPNRAVGARSPAAQTNTTALAGSGVVPARRGGAARGRAASAQPGLSRQQQPAGTGLSPLGSRQFTNAASFQAASSSMQTQPQQQQSQQRQQRSASVASRGRSAGRGATQAASGVRASAQGNDQQLLASLLGVGGASAVPAQQSVPARRPRTAAIASAAPVDNNATLNNLLGQQGRGQQRQNTQTVGASTANASANIPTNALDQSQQRAVRRPRTAATGAQRQPNNLGSVNFANGANNDGMINNDNEVNNDASSKNKYILVDRQGYRQGPKYSSTGAYGAALKAATAGHTDIYLCDRNHKAAPGGRVYSYAGGSVPITNPSEFTMRHGITTKPMVKSRGYVDLDANYAPMERKPMTGTF